jgi:hypothetical protein
MSDDPFPRRSTDVGAPRPPIEIYQITFSKAQLDAVPEDERTFYLMAGQLANDLNFLTKFLMFAINPVDGPPVLARVNTSLAMFQVRLLAGRLHEGWKMMKGKPFRDLCRKYEQELTSDTKTNLADLKTYFVRNTNLVEKIRNKVGFHSDVQLFKEGYNSFPPTEIFVDYLASARGHCLYFSGEIINVFAMTKLLPNMEWQKAFDAIARETTEIAFKITDVILDFMKVFMVHHIAETLGDLEKSKVVVENPLNADEVSIPFFCNPPRNYP